MYNDQLVQPGVKTFAASSAAHLASGSWQVKPRNSQETCTQGRRLNEQQGAVGSLMFKSTNQDMVNTWGLWNLGQTQIWSRLLMTAPNTDRHQKKTKKKKSSNYRGVDPYYWKSIMCSNKKTIYRWALPEVGFVGLGWGRWGVRGWGNSMDLCRCYTPIYCIRFASGKLPQLVCCWNDESSRSWRRYDLVFVV